jgi:hypothetical protein
MNLFIAIQSEGALIPLDTIDDILHGKLPGQKPSDFGLQRGEHLGDEIARAWSDAVDYWHIFRRRMEALADNDPGTTLTRERWILPVLTDLLGYELTYQPSGALVGAKTYPISHRAGVGEEAPPVHIVGFRQDLDRRDEGGHRRMSPQALVQEYKALSGQMRSMLPPQATCLFTSKIPSRSTFRSMNGSMARLVFASLYGIGNRL